MSIEKRANKRYSDESMVELGGKTDMKGRLVDLSVSGMRARFEDARELSAEMQYSLRIYPCRAPDLRPFSLGVIMVWSQNGRRGIEAGFRIIASPSGDEFQHYLDFLSYRNGIQNHAD